MRHQLLNDDHGQRTFAVVLETGDETTACLQESVRSNQILAARLTGIGAFAEAALDYFDWEKKDYISNVTRAQVGVASLIGDVALSPSGEPMLYIQAVVGKRDGTALAGHLQKARLRPALEVTLNESRAHLQKVHDPQSGLVRIRPKQ